VTGVRASAAGPVREDGRTGFAYAVLRVVPRVERGEALNAGVVLYARRAGFLAVRVGLDAARLEALAPGMDPAPIERHLEARVRIAAGDESAGAVAQLPQSERFAWLVAPSSTVIQPSPVHTGLCDEPEVALERLFREMVQ
jgi:pimeloyl-ACP methyl ester carboxylesterase